MKKHIIGIIAFAAITVVVGWGYIQNKQNVVLSDLALENVEALADNEYHEGYCSWRTGHSSLTGWVAICDHLGVGSICECGTPDKYYPDPR